MTARKIVLSQAVPVLKALSQLLGRDEPSFTLKQMLEMMSDEIAWLKERGHSSEDIARVIREAGVELTAEELDNSFKSSAVVTST
jgi:hypothetical protein